MRRRCFSGRRAPQRSAQALVEFALILPVMLIMVLGSIDIGRALVFGVEVQNGARESARLAATASDTTNGITDLLVQQRLIDASSPALDVCVATATWGVLQSCGWRFSVDVAEVSGLHIYHSLAEAKASNPQFLAGGYELKVSARADNVSIIPPMSTPWGWTLFPIAVQGQAAMVMR